MKVRINIPNWIVLVVGIVLGGVPAAWGIGRQLFENPATETIYASKVANGEAVNGYIPVAGYCTNTATGTGTADRLCYKPMPSGLPAGTPGQVPTIRADTTTGIVTATATQTATGTATVVTGTVTATGTVTGTGTHYEANHPAPDILGTYFLRWVEIGEYGNFPAWQRWSSLAWSNPAWFPVNHALSGTCSSGSQALIGHFEFDSNVNGDKDDGRALIPSGDWVLKLRAKVNANAATLRVVVMDHYGSPAVDHLILDASTDPFSNTSYQTVTKRVSMPEIWREPLITEMLTNAGSLEFWVYANCEDSTTVSVELNDPALSSRIETPLTFDELQIADVDGLSAALANVNGSITSLYDGKSGLPQASAGQVLCMSSNPNPYYILEACSPQPEPTLSGVQGQFVKFSGTGTSTTTSKEAVTIYSTSTPTAVATSGSVGTATTVSRSDHAHAGPTPITTRAFWVGVGDIDAGEGAVMTSLGVGYFTEGWVLRNAQNDAVFGASVVIPADYSSGLTISPHWKGYTSADATSSHTTKWRFGFNKYESGSDTYTYTTTTWTGSTCGSYCNVMQMIAEAPQSVSGTFAAGDVIGIYVQRRGSDAADTYTGDTMLMGLKFSYTSTQ